MKKKLIILITLLSFGICAKAQEYRLAKSNGQLKLNITGVIVEGYDGKDIIFSGQKVVTEELDDRAKGLVPITSSKYVDNTGLGINVTESGEIINVNLVAKKPIGVLTIKVPNNIKVSINNNSNSNRAFFSYTSVSGTNSNSSSNSNTNDSKAEDEIVIKNLKSELEVSVYWNKIRLENNTGPMNIKTVSGSVDAIFTGEIKGPVSIISATNYVDVTLPATTKANIEMGTSYGKLYAGKEFQIDFEKLEPESGIHSLIATRSVNGEGLTRRKDDDEAVAVTLGTLSGSTDKAKGTGTTSKSKNSPAKEGEATIITTNADARVAGIQLNGGTHIISGINYAPGTVSSIYSSRFSSGDRIKGKLNGGGVDLIFKSTNKNVYLRQQ